MVRYLDQPTLPKTDQPPLPVRARADQPTLPKLDQPPLPQKFDPFEPSAL